MGDEFPQKNVEAKDDLKLTSHLYLNVHEKQDIIKIKNKLAKQWIIFCSSATQTQHDIDHKIKITDSTKTYKGIKCKAFLHIIYQEILLLNEK